MKSDRLHPEKRIAIAAGAALSSNGSHPKPAALPHAVKQPKKAGCKEHGPRLLRQFFHECLKYESIDQSQRNVFLRGIDAGALPVFTGHFKRRCVGGVEPPIETHMIDMINGCVAARVSYYDGSQHPCGCDYLVILLFVNSGKGWRSHTAVEFFQDLGVSAATCVITHTATVITSYVGNLVPIEKGIAYGQWVNAALTQLSVKLEHVMARFKASK